MSKVTDHPCSKRVLPWCVLAGNWNRVNSTIQAKLSTYLSCCPGLILSRGLFSVLVRHKFIHLHIKEPFLGSGTGEPSPVGKPVFEKKLLESLGFTQKSQSSN